MVWEGGPAGTAPPFASLRAFLVTFIKNDLSYKCGILHLSVFFYFLLCFNFKVFLAIYLNFVKKIKSRKKRCVCYLSGVCKLYICVKLFRKYKIISKAS